MIRPAGAGDVDAIAAIWNAVIRDTEATFTPDEKTGDEIADMIRDRPGFLVSDGAEGVTGFVTYAQFRLGKGYAHSFEHTLHLAPPARGQGVGRLLLRAAERRAVDQGAHVMVAGVSSGNPGGRAFHLACGYTETGVVPQVGRKFGRWHDLHLLTRVLN